jgi:hypothetical protein
MSLRLGIVGLVASLVWCAAAYATSVQYNGPAASGNGAGVEFGAKQAHGRPAVVRRFEFHNIPAACAGYAGTAATDMLTITMKVTKSRRFSGTQSLNAGRLHVVVHGAFARNLKKATGTIRVRGTVPGCASADTGSVHWSASAL